MGEYNKCRCNSNISKTELNPQTGKPYTTCNGCRRRRRKAQLLLVSKGLCIRCKNPSTTTICTPCRRKNRELLKATGKCGSCSGMNDGITSMCSRCSFKSIARKTLGDSKRWVEISILFKSQNGKCAVTGLPIKIGEGTASLDHIIPQSGEDGTHDIKNLRWVHIKFNKLKQAMTDSELLDFITLVLKNKRNLNLT